MLSAAAMAWSSEVDKEDALLLINVLLQAVSAFVTVCHGFTAGAGHTLLAAVRVIATSVAEVSLKEAGQGKVCCGSTMTKRACHSLVVLGG